MLKGGAPILLQPRTNPISKPAWKRKVSRLVLITGLVILAQSGLAGIGRIKDESAAKNKLQIFKDFLERRMPVSLVVWEETSLHLPIAPPGIMPQQLMALTNSSRLYCGAWQDDMFFVRQIGSTNEIENLITPQSRTRGAFWVGKSEDAYWQISDGIVTLTKSDFKLPNPIYAAGRNGRSLLFMVLNLGMVSLSDVPVGWRDDMHLYGKDWNGQDVQGQIVTSLDGQPVSVRLGNSLCNYSYETDSLSGLPSTILINHMEGNSVLPLMKIRIISLHLSKSPLDATLFDPARFIVSGKAHFRIYTNGAFVPAGAMPLDSLDASASLEYSSNHSVRKLTLATMILASVLGLVCVFWRDRFMKGDVNDS